MINYKHFLGTQLKSCGTCPENADDENDGSVLYQKFKLSHYISWVSSSQILRVSLMTESKFQVE